MGIKNLRVLINKYSKSNEKIKKLSDHTDEILGLDTSCYLYAALTYQSHSDNNYLSYFVNQIINFLTHNITPVYIFDGEADEQKKEITLKKRKEKKEVALQKIHDLQSQITNNDVDNVDNKTIYQQIFEEKKKVIQVTPQHNQTLQTFFDLIGIQYYICNIEADVLLGYLSKQGVVDGVLSNDSDLLLLGCSNLIKGYKNQKCSLIEWNLQEILESLKLSESQFICCCILMGCDILQNQKNMGPINCYKMVQNIDYVKLLEKLKNLFDEEYVKSFIQVYEKFTQRYFSDLSTDLKQITRNSLRVQNLKLSTESTSHLMKLMKDNFVSDIQAKKLITLLNKPRANKHKINKLTNYFSFKK